jgi:hypothetical protein
MESREDNRMHIHSAKKSQTCDLQIFEKLACEKIGNQSCLSIHPMPPTHRSDRSFVSSDRILKKRTASQTTVGCGSNRQGAKLLGFNLLSDDMKIQTLQDHR